MKRADLRENVFKLLFNNEFYEESEIVTQCQLYFDNVETLEKLEMTEKDKEYIIEKVKAIVGCKAELDEAINKVSVGWSTDRMSKVDLTIIRLAYYEMIKDEDVPKKVAIDQAVEIAKNYGSDESPAFINGILAKLY